MEALAAHTPTVALGDAHISQLPSRSEGAKVFQAMLEGDGTWRPGGAIAVPAAQTRDDPGGPGEAVPDMRIFLLLGSALDLRVDGFQGRHLLLWEGQAGRFGAAPVTVFHPRAEAAGGFGG